MTPTATRSRPSEQADSVLAEAVDVARAAVVEEAGADLVGDYLGHEADDERVVTHYFASLEPSYVGWRWAATLARASRAKTVTVDEVVLLPGEGALLPPAWVPWQERLRPGDLGVGDILPTTIDDDRLVPAYAAVEDPEVQHVADELGLGRVRVLSPIGRDDAVDRWYVGDRGPEAPIAKAAPATCGTCGFWLPLAGALRGFFGVCANEFAPDDARVVSADHGCGGHSEGLVLTPTPAPTPHHVEGGAVADDYEVVVGEEPTIPEPATEELGHS
ncbi:MAG: hypothetical protein QOG53_25 [Frankiales bacterium]|jgi:hypothetical protein|nr:hypothetical protein [Frankiales bacterium]